MGWRETSDQLQIAKTRRLLRGERVGVEGNSMFMSITINALFLLRGERIGVGGNLIKMSLCGASKHLLRGERIGVEGN